MKQLPNSNAIGSTSILGTFSRGPRQIIPLEIRRPSLSSQLFQRGARKQFSAIQLKRQAKPSVLVYDQLRIPRWANSRAFAWTRAHARLIGVWLVFNNCSGLRLSVASLLAENWLAAHAERWYMQRSGKEKLPRLFIVLVTLWLIDNRLSTGTEREEV